MDKKDLRNQFKTLRRKHTLKHGNYHTGFFKGFFSCFKAKKNDRENILSGFYPLENEINIFPILHELHKQTVTVCLPVIEGDNQLTFRSLTNTNFALGPLGILYPKTQNIVLPNILLVPLLVCNLKGQRLGYGKGYYDKTLSILRSKNPKMIAIGICWSFQIVMDDLPQDEFDQKLDYILTERELINID